MHANFYISFTMKRKEIGQMEEMVVQKLMKVTTTLYANLWNKF